MANTVSTGALTIPNMKRLGYPGHFAGGVEAAASAGGQITPPIMGAAAFIMAEFLELPYTTIVIAAIFPALLHYVGVFAVVHLMARKLNLTSEIGKMLDPIADKAMVIIALMVLVMRDNVSGPILSAGQQWIVMRDGTFALLVVPAVIIMLRETLVSGLREYLGDVKLAVTQMAKWKTTVQMVAIGVLLAVEPVRSVSAGATPRRYLDYPEVFETMAYPGYVQSAGIVLLWLAAALTLISGLDYFRKGLAHIRAREAG